MAGNPENEGEIFGDLSLFENFADAPAPIPEPEADSDDQDETVCQLRQKMEELKKENLELKRQMRLLLHPGNLKAGSAESQPPIAQVLLFNHDTVCFKRQEIEDFFQRLPASLIDVEETGDIRPLPQRSSRPLFQDLASSELEESFTVTGNVQYYQSYCIDSLGRPLVSGDPKQTAGWTIPCYTAVFHEALPIEETTKPSKHKEKRSKPTCWNCGQEEHTLRDCPLPRDMEKISAARKEFQAQGTPQNASLNKRYHKEGEAGEGRFAAFRPGQISAQLREALNLDERQVPPYIYQMRLLGYPPGYLKQAEVLKSGLTVYNIRDEDEPGEISNEDVNRQPTYDPSKLIDYPGFNVPLPEGVRDPEGVPPMQPAHSKEALRVLLTPSRAAESSRKRERRDFSEDPDRKRQRAAGSDRDEVDMDLEGNTPGTVRHTSAGDDSPVFKPPLPPTPIPETPPPLPTSTPPVTPRDGDAARSPPRGGESPGSPRSCGASLDEEAEGEFSSSASPGAMPGSLSPSMDDLRQMQSRLQEALLQAAEEGGGGSGGGVLASDTDSTGASFMVDGEEFLVEGSFSEEEVRGRPPGESPEEPGKETPEHQDATPGEETEESATAESSSEGALGAVPEAAIPSTPGPCPEDAPTLPPAETPNRSGVPHLSKFAEGISPHENENLSESTGVLRRILGIFKRKKGKASS